ncbi:MAG: hypothetical protein ACO3JL_08545 [Myxococcota bacterium]
MMPRHRLSSLIPFALAASALSACHSPPRAEHVQWVARDAWNPRCAELAIVERFHHEPVEWVEDGVKARVAVDATFKLANDCEGLKAYQSFDFKLAGLEMVRCDSAGSSGWALAARPDRCWTGPKLLAP